jgi:protein SDA1
MVTTLKILRGKDLVPPFVIIPVFLKLFKCKDKELRRFLHNGIISDLKKLNLTSKNHAVNKKLQTFIFDMLKDPNETSSRRALNVMIELYKRKIWNDDKTVNVIAEGCLHDNPKIVAAAAKFFLVLDYDWDTDSDDEEDESSDEENKKLLMKKYKGTKKMTKKRMTQVEKTLKQHKRKEKRKGKVKYSTDFLPIDLIHDPQNFAEKLFNKLRKSNDRYEVKLLMMRLISRMIGRH